MTGDEYRDLIAGYILRNVGERDLVVYTEVALGKTIIGKARKVDVFVVRAGDQRALAIECKYQGTKGTTDEKILYALEDLGAMWIPGCLAYAGTGWSPGVIHTLEVSRKAAFCHPDPATLARGVHTLELDHILAATFGLWDAIIPRARRFQLPA